ncbi:tetratricopeptide repeat protein [Flavobacterium sp.]|jgi:tetratricopeptide (TPR) repeat protein|uniref:tetratricopeptide repeat protein n=1 Tax=Flavobacterium sp. TaxID=239 RepID=UPI0037BE9047
MKKIFLFLLIAQISFAQKDGFWDKERAFTKEIKLSAGNRTLVKIEDLPEGASEFVFRILLIDENGKITNSLASVLKAIPDPTGISQGTAGALFLTNSLSGDDKCVYGIYTSEKTGNQFLKDGKLETACYFSKEPINKDSKVISIKNTNCFENAPSIWFGFENKNWVLSTKIVLEVVSWVDYSASRGWNLETKKELVVLGKKLDWYKKSSNQSLFLAQFVESFTEKYKFSEYNQLLTVEKSKAINEMQEIALKKTNQFDSFLTTIRVEAIQLNNKNKVEEAISKIQNEIIFKNTANHIDYGLIGSFYLLSKQFEKAELNLEKAILLDKTDLTHRLNLSYVYLFTDRVSEAKDLHNQYKTQNINSNVSWVNQTKSDFSDFEKNGFTTDNFKKILRILE